jgi:peptidyl-prolyl cis-trans isomerase D
MLQNIRDKSKSWLSVTIIAVIILSFALWGIQRLFMGSASNNAPVAKVFGSKVTEQQLSMEYDRLRRQAELNKQYFTNTDLAGQLKKQALQNLVTSAAMNQAAAKAGYSMDNVLIGGIIGTMPMFQESGHFSQARFIQIASSMGYTPQDFFQIIQENLINQQVESGIVGTSFILPNELAQAKDFLHQERQFNYMVIPASAFMSSVKVSENQLKSYYQTHQDEFKLPEQVSVQYVELSQSALEKNLNPNILQLKQFYNDNIDRFHHKPYQAIQADVEQAYREQEAQKVFEQEVSRLSDLSDEHPGSLQAVAAGTGLVIQTTSLFSRTDTFANGILSNPVVIQAAFSNEVLHQQGNSDLIRLPNNIVVILRMKNYQAAANKPYETVKSQIQTILKKQLAIQKAKDFAQTIADEMKKGRSSNSPVLKLAMLNHVAWTITPFVSRSNKDVSTEILDAAFLLPLPTTKQASVTSVDLGEGGYAIILLKAVRNEAPNKTAPQLSDSAEKIMEQVEGQTLYQLYQQQVLHEAGVKYY